MIKRVCLSCKALHTGKGSRCDACSRSKEAHRNATKGQKYRDPEYNAVRKQWALQIKLGLHVLCSRCGMPVGPAFDLDHHPTKGLHPAHPTCNRSAGAK